MGRTYPKPAGGAPNFPALESEVLDYWDTDDTFRASVARRDDAPEYVFYDGPPFANGLPHYGHLLTGYVKDIVPRYRTMRGYKVDRRFGWDTHGLPAELEVQRQLGITDKAQIDEMGIGKFNDACRDSVLKYTDEWRAYVTRQARWVDFDNDYKTLDPTFMESVIWAFKQLWDKGLAYEGYRVLPYCWNDETPLSSHELRMDDDVYQSRQDPAITVGFRDHRGRRSRARTCWSGRRRRGRCRPTRPWPSTPTSPTSRCAAPDGAPLRAGAGPAGGLRPRTRRGTRGVGHPPGRRAAGYALPAAVPVFHGLAQRFSGAAAATSSPPRTAPASCTCRPAYGEDDKATTDTVGIEPVTPVDAKGRFDATVPDYAGSARLRRQPADHPRPEEPHRSGAANGAVLLRHETYEHSYPHCWRCRNPLIYRAVSSWFVKVTEFRDRMVELNQQITWYPEHVKDGQFGKWLSRRPRLVDLAKPILGQPDSGVEVRRPGLSADRCLRQPRRTRA